MKIPPVATTIITAFVTAVIITSASTNAVEEPPITTHVETSVAPAIEEPIAPAANPVETTPPVETIETSPETEEPVTTATPETDAPETMVEYDNGHEMPVVLWPHVPLEARLQEHISNECAKYEIDPLLVVAMIFRESAYKSDAIGDNGNSVGLMQIQERFHGDRMQKLNVSDLRDPFQNVTVGIDFLAEEIGKYRTISEALTAYNAGDVGAYKSYFSKGIYESEYAREVLDKWEELLSK